MKEHATYQVVLTEAEEGGYIVSVPDIEGCYTEGDTMEEALAMAKEAIEGVLVSMAKAGRPIPKPASVALPVDVLLPAKQERIVA